MQATRRLGRINFSEIVVDIGWRRWYSSGIRNKRLWKRSQITHRRQTGLIGRQAQERGCFTREISTETLIRTVSLSAEERVATMTLDT